MNNLSNKTFKHVCTGIGISLISSFVFLCIFALLLMYTNISESTISPVIIIITGISILIGTIICTRKLSKNGIITGGVVGVLYILIIYLISSLLNCDFSLNIQSFVMIVVSIICGMIGVIIGFYRRILLYLCFYKCHFLSIIC